MAVKHLEIEPLKETVVRLEIEGESDLILHKRSRYYEQAEVWKQGHDKGAKMPEIYSQGKISGRDLLQAFTGKTQLNFTTRTLCFTQKKNGITTWQITDLAF